MKNENTFNSNPFNVNFASIGNASRWFILLLIMVLWRPAMGQDASSQWKIITTDKNTFTGTIVTETIDTIYLLTDKLGTLKIPTDQIHSKYLLKKDGRASRQSSTHPTFSTRYFIGPSALMLKKGEGYYQNNWVFFNQASYGITDNFTFGVGTIPVWLLGAPAAPTWITPKLGTRLGKNLHIAAGALVGSILSEFSSEPFGVTYGMLTYGRQKANISLGLGYGFAGETFANTPTITLSAAFELTRSTSFVTENFIVGENGGWLAAGFRTCWPKISLDYGLFTPLGAESLFALPWLGVTIPFQIKKKRR